MALHSGVKADVFPCAPAHSHPANAASERMARNVLVIAEAIAAE